jgi:hypothetical protein
VVRWTLPRACTCALQSEEQDACYWAVANQSREPKAFAKGLDQGRYSHHKGNLLLLSRVSTRVAPDDWKWLSIKSKPEEELARSTPASAGRPRGCVCMLCARTKGVDRWKVMQAARRRYGEVDRVPPGREWTGMVSSWSGGSGQ